MVSRSRGKIGVMATPIAFTMVESLSLTEDQAAALEFAKYALMDHVVEITT